MITCPTHASWHVRVYIHSLRSIIEATEMLKQQSGSFPGGGGIWSPEMDLWLGIWTAFQHRDGDLNKTCPKIQMPRGCPGGDVEALIWLVHNFSSNQVWKFDAKKFITSLFQIFLGVSAVAGLIAGVLTLCLFYVGLFVLGKCFPYLLHE